MGQPLQVLSRLLDPPQTGAISRAMTILREVGATRFDTDVTTGSDVVLTPLGFHLAALPLNVRIAKMLVYAAVFGVLYPAVSYQYLNFNIPWMQEVFPHLEHYMCCHDG